MPPVPPHRPPWRPAVIAACVSAVVWSAPVIAVSTRLASPPWWVWLALALPPAAVGVAACRPSHPAGPVRAAVVANLLLAAGVGLPVAAVVGGGLPWLVALVFLRTPIGCVLAAPVLGAAFGAVVGLVVLALDSSDAAGKGREADPHERAAAVTFLTGGDPTPHVVLSEVSKAETALGRALTHPRLRPVLSAAGTVGAVLTVAFGTLTLVGWGWPSVAAGAAAGAVVVVTRAARSTPGQAGRGWRWMFWAAAAVVGVWYAVALPLAVWVPAAFPPPPAQTPPPVASPPVAPFTAGEAGRVAAELDRRQVGPELLRATHPSGEYRSATPTALAPTSDGGRLVGQVDVTWWGTSGAVHRTTYALTLTRDTADVEVRADTAFFQVKAINRSAARRALARLSAEAQAAVRQSEPRPGQ